MKKTILIAVVVVFALGALGVGIAFAQGGKPPFGPMRGGRGVGPMHDYVMQALAGELGLTQEQVEEQLVAGKTMYQIALDNGIKQEELANFMIEVHQAAFANAVRDGVITQEQADWVLQRMQTMNQNGVGLVNCPMHNGQGASLASTQRMGPGMMWGTQNP